MSTFIVSGDFDTIGDDLTEALNDRDRRVIVYCIDNANYATKQLVELVLQGEVLEIEYLETDYQSTRKESTTWLQLWTRPSKDRWQEHLDDVEEFGYSE